MAERWVLRDDAPEMDLSELPGLMAKVQELYLDDYAAGYENLIYDVQLAPFANASEAATILNILSRPGDSPHIVCLLTQNSILSQVFACPLNRKNRQLMNLPPLRLCKGCRL